MANGFQFPQWFTPTPQMGELQRTYRQLPKMFDTSAMEANTQQQIGMNTARGAASASAMARAAQNRAAQMGGSVASSFAAGSAMLPIYAQNAAMLGDMEDRKLNANAQQAGMRSDIARMMAQLRQQQLGMQSGLYGNEMARMQQGEQFNASLGQRQDEFGDDLDIRKQQLELQKRQQALVERQYRERLKGMSIGGAGGVPNWDQYLGMQAVQNSGSPQALNMIQRMQQVASRLPQSGPFIGSSF